MSQELENLLASMFITRTDVKAVQHNDGSYAPHTANGRRDGQKIGWRREDLSAHIAGRSTFGHYLLSPQGECKLVAFDIDLTKAGYLPVSIDSDDVVPCADLRAAWRDRAHPARWHMKLQFKQLAHKIATVVSEKMRRPVAVAYSGSKGVHVYAFTGQLPGAEQRQVGRWVLELLEFQPGEYPNHFVLDGFPNLSVELYPRQDDLVGKNLGNLMRLPLGKNWKNPQDPTFFVDMTAPLGSMVPIDPVIALTKENPWV